MASIKLFERNLNTIINVFSKTKRTTVRMSKDIPTAAFDIINDVFLYNEEFVVQQINELEHYLYKESLYMFNADSLLAYFLAGHELGHQYFTKADPDKFIEPVDLTKFVINIVEDSYIEKAWKTKHFSEQLKVFNESMTIYRKFSVQDNKCLEIDQQDVSIKSALFYLLYSSYNTQFVWSKEFLPQYLIDYFNEVLTMVDDDERFEHTIEFTRLLLEHFKDNLDQQQQQSNDQGSEDGDELGQAIKEFMEELPEQYKSELKETLKGLLSPLDLVEDYSNDGINFFSPQEYSETQNYKSLFTSMSNLFNKYRFRVKNDTSYNEKRGDVDMKNIPFSNIRTDFFMQHNEYKRDFDFEFVVTSDFSGSMDSVETYVSDITAAFTNACVVSKIPITVYGFDGSSYLLADDKSKSLKHNYNMIKSAFKIMGGSTNLLPTIKNGINKLRKSNHKDKIFVIITDGETYNLSSIKELLRQKYTDIHFVGISIENGEYLINLLKEHKVFHYEDSFMLKTLPNDLIGYIYDTFMKGDNL